MSFEKCPMCGFTEKNIARPVSHVMNTYKNEKGETAVFNSTEKFIENPHGKWTLQKPDHSQEILSLKHPGSSAAIKAVAEVESPVVSEEQGGDPSTGLAKGATVVGHSGARAPIVPTVK